MVQRWRREVLLRRGRYLVNCSVQPHETQVSLLQGTRALSDDAEVEVELQAVVIGHLRCQLMKLRLGMCVPGACVRVDEFLIFVIARWHVRFAKASQV